MSVSACVYDHRITQAIQERRRRAKAAEGAAMRSAPSSKALRPAGAVAFYVAPEYREQHPQYRESLADLVETSNGVIGPAFGVRIDVSTIRAWEPRCERAKLADCLAELRTEAGDDEGGWVVGVLGALPRYTASFDELGMADVPGKHMVLRDVSDLLERRAIDEAFASFTPSRREEIYSKRKAHKRLAVFLHEWGHTLGALHSSETTDLLYPNYDDRMSAFGAANSALIGAGLEDRSDQAALHPKLLAALDTTDGSEINARERDALRERLRTRATATSAISAAPGASNTAAAVTFTHPFVVNGSEDTLLAGIPESERAQYRVTIEHLQRDDVAGAHTALAPLLSRHPDCYAVQHLGCGLLMQLSRGQEAQTVCTRAQKLSAAAR